MATNRGLVLVTGANGFLGSHLTEELLRRGYRVRAMVRNSSDLSYVQNLPVEWFFGDLTDGDALRRVSQGVDAVCHCAALTRALDEATFLRVNTEAVERLALACIEENPNLGRFLFVSSQTAAGPAKSAEDVVDESHLPEPITWYGRSKWEAEQRLLRMADRLPLTILRPSAVFGERDRDFFTYFDMINRGISLRVGRTEQWINLIYVRDLVTLILLALESENALGQTYFGCAYRCTHREIPELIARAFDKNPLVITLPEAILTPIALSSKLRSRLTGRPGLLNEQRIIDMRQRYFLCSGEKARQELGFEPRYRIDEAFENTAKWYMENGWL